MRRGAKVLVSWGSALALVLVLVPSALRSQAPAGGGLVGFVYEQDGSTPVAGAVVVVKNVSTGAVTEAGRSDALGIFRVPGLGPGLYALGVTSPRGNFNSQDFFGVTAGKTSKITVALNPYDSEAAAAAAAVIKAQRDKGEAFIGKVVKYLAETKEAEVLIEIGLIQSEDRIHVKGQSTDFYQDMRSLKAYGAKAKRVTSGYTAVIRTAKPCEAGDFVYIVCKRGVPPFFLAPLGIAAIVAGAIPLEAIYDDIHVSPYRIRQDY
jgi:hypothetical protein